MDEGRDFVDRHLRAYLGQLSPSLSRETVRHKTQMTRDFLAHLAAIGMTDLCGIDPDVVYAYVISLDYAPQTRSGLEFQLREVFDVFCGLGLADVAGRTLFPLIRTGKRDRILSFYTPDEVRDIVSQADLSAPNGVRDKCMVLLAAQLGMRSGDVLDLRLGDVKWERDAIERIQSKTGLPLSVPLPMNVKLLLADYIRSHRPQSETDYVFVCEATRDRFCASQLNAVLRRLMRKSAVEPEGRKHGPHALRHSLASSMLAEGAPLPVISGVLGHSSTQTTRAYLGIDIDALRRVSLEVPGHAR